MGCVTVEEGVEEGEEGGQKRGPSLEARQHQQKTEEEEGVGRGESWMAGKEERAEEDKGSSEGGTWHVGVVVVGGV